MVTCVRESEEKVSPTKFLGYRVLAGIGLPLVWIWFATTASLASLIVFFGTLVCAYLGWAAPLTPIQILWINLITNGLPALALGVDPKDPDQMKQPPRPAEADEDTSAARSEPTPIRAQSPRESPPACTAFRDQNSDPSR